ncbi:MAG TPA: aldo/keto reductase [Verrucomicrobiales bacterium]|nr:aldo/keto reductase [Verrucomicrobiales bacterium]
MKEVRIGKSTLRVSRLAFGCWRIAGTWEARKVNAKARESGLKAILAAYETGYTLFDLADIYCDGISEELFGLALKQSKSLKKSAVIATKCGIRIPEAGETYRYDLSANYIIQSCENSLQRLGVDCLDIYQLHRPDWLMDPNEVAKAFAKLKKAGKVRHFGISNFKPSQVSLLQSALKDSLVVNQIEISLLQLASFEDGTLDQCQQHKITPMAWSPLAGGYLGDGKSNVLPSQEKYKPIKIRRRLDTLARELGTSRSAIALAWLLKHPSGIIPIIGTTKPSRIRELAEADQIELSHEQWYTLLTSALKEDLP